MQSLFPTPVCTLVWPVLITVFEQPLQINWLHHFVHATHIPLHFSEHEVMGKNSTDIFGDDVKRCSATKCIFGTQKFLNQLKYFGLFGCFSGRWWISWCEQWPQFSAWMSSSSALCCWLVSTLTHIAKRDYTTFYNKLFFVFRFPGWLPFSKNFFICGCIWVSSKRCFTSF